MAALNSEVLPKVVQAAPSVHTVAVAVTASPAARLTGRVSPNVTVPAPPVVTLVKSR